MLDHIVYAVPDLAKATADLEHRLGVRATSGGKHTGLGTHNALLSLSEDTYLEIIGPDPDQPPPTAPRPFGIDTLQAPRLLTWLAKATNLDEQLRRARALGYDLGTSMQMRRDLPNGSRLEWRLALPPQPLGDWLVPVLIEWHTDQHPAKTSARGCRLVKLYAEHPQPNTVSAILAAMELTLDIRKGPVPGLFAILDTPKGQVVLH